MTVSPQLRVVAMLALAAALAGGGGMLLLARQQASTATPKVIKPLHPVKHHVRTVTTHVSPKAKHAVKPTPTPALKPHPKPKPAVVDGLPAPLARALASHPVVVLALYAPNSSVDVISAREARAGAEIAGVGFVALDVTKESNTRSLTSLLASAQPADRVLDSPAVLVFQRPKALFVRLNGYNDAPTVAQAAENAAPLVTGGLANAQTAWMDAANAACTRMSQQLQTVARQFLASPTNAATLVNQLLTVLQSAVTQLRGLPAPASYKAQVRLMLADYDAALAKTRQALTAVQQGDKAKAQQLVAQAKVSGGKGDHIAYLLGATRCGSS